ncbi:MAG: hypothetical protein ACHQVK_01385 [Candidatus Paceibacterales bacterium]
MKDQKRKETKELISAIRKIFFYNWDPLNVEGAINVDDEYDDFISPVMAFLTQKPSREQIVEFLKNIEEKELGGLNDIKNTENAALKLKMLSEEM